LKNDDLRDPRIPIEETLEGNPWQELFPQVSEMECDYFRDGRKAKLLFLTPNELLKNSYHYFLTKGFRRYGEFYYTNICEGCAACIPIRVPVDEFKISKSQRRCLSKNQDIILKSLFPSELDDKKLGLYTLYKKTKHPDNEAHQYREEIAHCHYGYHQTHELQFYLNDKLVGLSILDEAEDSLSAVYFYYNTQYLERRLGIYSMLKEIEYAQRLGKKYYYLGFYIEAIERMAYKKYIRPNEILKDGSWVPFMSADKEEHHV
jgi:arginyl-tRNA--protein-N-Asp/Glu arginylyltransferase